MSRPTIAQTLSTELSDREVYLIGSIVSQWGFLESEIVEQTLLSFAEYEALPKAMNNAQFSLLLPLWLERVVEPHDGVRRAILRAQHDEIVRLAEYRQAIVHSRWSWRPDMPDRITAIRVHRKSVVHVSLTVDDLDDIAVRLGQVRYAVRYPGGTEDRGAELAASGGYLSRRGYDLLAGRTALPG